jgi:hypothetical protein
MDTTPLRAAAVAAASLLLPLAAVAAVPAAAAQPAAPRPPGDARTATAAAAVGPAPAAARPSFSGVYPHLAMFNNEAECGTGAVVPWAGKLWALTYAPHMPKGSSDKLYEIAPDLTQTVRPESIGGTPANRLIHRESNQLFIGPYAVAADGAVRAIPYTAMSGRHTATARHLTDPAGKVYYATMEEGFYEVDVKTLAVTELYKDGNSTKNKGGDLLPGYHGKGAYSGQGRLVYANNGELSPLAQKKPDIESGILAEWDGKKGKDPGGNPSKDWTIVRRNQFTEVTGPGGIYGNADAAKDPVWSIGWDHRSLILMLLDGGAWHAYRLPKGSHSYDGAHGWNTEWPRIRDVGSPDGSLLMTMHGTFWRFPKTFSAADAAGIRPRSNYLRVIGDFARWADKAGPDKLVFGCDDTAKSEFLNKRKAKGDIAGPGQSQSNLWFVEPAKLDQLGPALGKGAVWVNEPAKAGVWSDPFLFAGYDRRAVHLAHGSAEAVTFEFEVDVDGKGKWKPLKSVEVPPKAAAGGAGVGTGGYLWVPFDADAKGEWVRVRTTKDAAGVTAWFHYANADRRKAGEADPMFDGVAKAADAASTAGYVRARGDNKRTLGLAAASVAGTGLIDVGYYEMDADAKLRRVEDQAAHEFTKKSTVIPQGVLTVDAASVLYVDDAGKRWRLPKGDAAFDALTAAGRYRVSREVCTERDLFNCHGTFYELPADNAGGFGKVRPVTTHNRRIFDYCSYRGLTVLTGVVAPDGGAGNDAGGGGGAGGSPANPHVVRSDDGRAAVWAGAVDDLWKLGKPVGTGGPWSGSPAKAGVPSDPYLMNGYDAKKLTLSHGAGQPVTVHVEVDVNGDGLWVPYASLAVPPGQSFDHAFPAAFQACWVRFVADQNCAATAVLTYE